MMNTKLKFFTILFSTVSSFLILPNIVIAQDEEDEDENSQSEVVKDGELGNTGFFVEDFVPNRLKVEAKYDNKRHNYTSPMTVEVKAEEMFGQPAGNKPVNGYVRYTPIQFQASQFPDYDFSDNELKFDAKNEDIEEIELSDKGQANITVPAPKKRPPSALKAQVQIAVQDEGRAVTKRLSGDFDPVKYYLGIKSDSGSMAKINQPVHFSLVGLNPDQTLYSEDSNLSATIYQVRWNSILQKNGDSFTFVSNRQLEKSLSADIQLSAGKGAYEWSPKAEGSYLIHVQDTKSTASVSYNFYASSGSWNNQPWSLEKPENAELSLDKKSYKVGEKAKVLIKSPFPGTVLLTQEQDKVLSTTVLKMETNTIEIEVPVETKHEPNFYLSASIMRPVKSASKWLPHRAIGIVNVPVVSADKKLGINIEAPNETLPNSQVTVKFNVKDDQTSAPAESTVFVWAVDEGILSLTGYETPSPFDYFYAIRKLLVSTADLYSSLMPDIINSAIPKAATGGGDALDAANRLSPVSGERIKPIVIWAGKLKSDPQGNLATTLNVPEYMGRLRIMAIAAGNNKFGSADKYIFVRSPLMLRENFPRFAAPGDKFDGIALVYNNTDKESQVNVQLHLDNKLLNTVSGTDSSSNVPFRGNASIQFPITVGTEEIGNSQIQLNATSSNSDTYSTSLTLPIRPASPRILSSTTERIQTGETKAIQIGGKDFLPASTSVTLTVSGLPTVQLADGLNYNLSYPYGCAEQTISRIFPLLTLPSLASELTPGRYSDDGIKSVVQDGIDRIFLMQTYYGGIASWPGNREPSLWSSIYAGHFLAEAKKAGYQVPETYLSELLSYISSSAQDSDTKETVLTQNAYAMYVLALNGKPNHTGMQKLFDARSKLSYEAKSLLAATYMRLGDKQTATELLPKITGAKLLDSRLNNSILSSPARETAVLLSSYLDIDAGSPEVVNLAQRLMKLKSKDYGWGTTQDNAFVLWSLGRYIEANKSKEPAEGTITLPDGNTLQVTDGKSVTITSGTLAGSEVKIASTRGDLYVFSTAAGVPLKPLTTPINDGMEIRKSIKTRNGEDADLSSIRQGDLLVVNIQFNSTTVRSNLVVEDLLPAGFEIENSNLASSVKLSEEEEDDDSGITLSRRDIRDDRYIAFLDVTRATGSQSEKPVLKYVVRAVTPGTFVLPAVKASAMYNPEVVSQTVPQQITIKPRSK